MAATKKAVAKAAPKAEAKPKAEAQKPTVEACAPANPFGDVFDMVKDSVQAAPAKAGKGETPEVPVPDALKDIVDEKGKVIPGPLSNFMTETATKKAAEGALDTLGAKIRPELEKVRVSLSREAKSFNMSINVDGKLTYSAGNLNVVGPKDPKSANNVPIPLQVKATMDSLLTIFGAENVKKYFAPEHCFTMVSRLPDTPETVDAATAQKSVLAEIKKRLGPDFGTFFQWTPTVSVVKAKEGSVLLADATMDTKVEAMVKQAMDQGLLSQSDGRLATRSAGTAGKSATSK